MKKLFQNRPSTVGLKKSFAYIGRYKFLIVLTLLLAALNVASTLYVPILIGDAIDLMIGEGSVVLKEVAATLVTAVIVAAAGGVALWLMSVVNNRITYNVVRDIRRDAFGKIQRLPISYLDSHPAGDIVSRVIADVDQFSDGLLMGFTQLFTGLLTIVATLVFMFIINPLIAAVVVVLTPLSLFIASFIAKKTHRFFQDQSRIRGEQTDYINEMVENVKTVKAFSNEERVSEGFREVNERLEKSSLSAIFFSSLVNPTTRFVNSVVYAAVAGFGAFSAVAGAITVGELSVFLSYANQYTKPFNEISGVVTELQNALACADRIFELIEQPVEEEASDAQPLSDAQGDVSLSDVHFAYDPSRPLIQGLTQQVRCGQRVAIVGPTGCGKTTLINLLMRFYDVDDGLITVDGKDIRRLTRHSLRRHYGMVLQDTWLRSGTIRDNIVMGKPDATDEEVAAAARASHAHSFIRRLPNGYHTVIGEDGGSLSQGQKQLLCITRIMLCLPPMLILDEATSSIDTRTELKIQDAFARMMKGRTSFIVAHRLSTIRDADIILVMKDGNVIEQGNHDELLSAGGFYANLYNSQFDPT